MSPEDVVVERLERELRLLESDYSRTIRAGIPLANGSGANGHPGMAAQQRRDGRESEEEESAAPEGYSMLPSDEEQGSALEASDSDAEQDSDGAGQQAEDETPADGDANRSAAQDGAAAPRASFSSQGASGGPEAQHHLGKRPCRLLAVLRGCPVGFLLGAAALRSARPHKPLFVDFGGHLLLLNLWGPN